MEGDKLDVIKYHNTASAEPPGPCRPPYTAKHPVDIFLITTQQDLRCTVLKLAGRQLSLRSADCTAPLKLPTSASQYKGRTGLQ